MRQYRPERDAHAFRELARSITEDELSHAEPAAVRAGP
jgi:uncharacterized Fe-S radical SAM superfamily protein PflX